MKRVVAAISLTIAGLALVLGFKTREVPTAAPSDTTRPPTGETTTTSPGTTAAAIQVDGPTVQTPYGPVQVAVVVSGGTLVDIIALQLPSGNSETNAINGFAGPRLREMALQAQSAQIDVVSGATFTSRGYAASLQAALDGAGL